MQKVIFTIGIPASGKSTWAREFARDNRHYFVSERDQLRAELYGKGDILNYKYSREREKEVTKTQLDRILSTLNMDCSVIISDTNLNEGVRDVTKAIILAKYPAVVFEEKVFDTSLKICIKRNMKRHASVPESVMIRMERSMRAYLGKPQYEHTEGLARCIIVDIDGTVADMKGIRKPYEWSKVGEDKSITINTSIVFNHAYDGCYPTELIFFSGRDSVCRKETERWLNKYFLAGCYQLHMRPEGNSDSDDIIKENLFYEHVHNKYNVDFVMDDRKQVCQLWESMGLNLINVGGTTSDF